MSDQCPSSKKEGKAGKAELAASSRELGRLAGSAESARVWRSLDEVADTIDFRDWIEKEFPAGASELNDSTTRRSFLKIMGASVALAGAATLPGCRRPDHKILTYSAKVPEDTIPGKPTYYATSMPLPGGGAEGLLVETHEGRPTKVEGNPLHPNNRGKSTVWSQASVLNMYDPDRLKYPVFRGAGDTRVASWDDFKNWAKENFARFDKDRGKGLAFIVEKKTSIARDAMRDRIKTRFPQAMWIPYEAVDSDSKVAGASAAFGQPMRELLTFSAAGKVAAKVIVSLDRDFLEQSDPGCLTNSREFANTRRALTVKDEMSRLYVVETGFSITGGAADHRLRLAPTRIAAFAVALAKAVMAKVQGADAGLASAINAVTVPAGEDIPQKFVDAVAEDLIAEADGHGGGRTRAGETLILAGDSQPAAVHALCHALNAVLGNVGKTVKYFPMRADEAANSAAGLASVINDNSIKLMVCIGVNPVYDAPAELDFAAKYKKIDKTVCLSVGDSETAAASTWSLNGAHYLESWGDTESYDGTISPIQPMIAPLYDPAKSDIELLAIIADPEAAIVKSDPAAAPVAATPNAPAPPKMQRIDDGHVIVQAAWRAMLGGSVNQAAFEKKWKRALHDGVLENSAKPAATPKCNYAAVATEVSKLSLSGPPTEASLDVLFSIGRLHDGRYTNNAWLQELPATGTRVVWDNPALMSPKTAEKLGLAPERFSSKEGGAEKIYTQKYPEAQVASVKLNGRSVEVAVWIMPGMADNTVILPLGYGRQNCGRVGDGVGHNVYPLRETASRQFARGATITKLPKSYPITSTQNHWSLEGRTALLRQVDLVAWQTHGDKPNHKEKDRLYGTAKELNFAEQVGGRYGDLKEGPPTLNIYPHPYNLGEPKPGEKSLGGRGLTPEPGSAYSKGPQWGMSIDLSTCTGCGACTTACQSENNIAVIGKKEVAKGREMSWIRVDRYFVSDASGELGNINEPTQMLHQPVACVHCENAPCETVCPVNATVHGPEGVNYMTYNRCIGTRYCANNCPYKVRRFNFFDYGVTKFNGDYIGKDTVESVAPDRGGVNGSGQHNKVNVNLIPPRLRQKLDEITRMQKNPDVTVRSRGVMEKCSYCIQRINEARIEMKVQDLGTDTIPEGFLQSACQQACPSNAIVFGDILDKTSNGGKGSAAYQMREHQRSYLLLGYLNTRPRTTHMVRVANPNPKLRTPVENPFEHHSEGGHEEHKEGGGAEKKPSGHAMLEDGEVSRATFLRDGAKRIADKGYALSLRVLGGMA